MRVSDEKTRAPFKTGKSLSGNLHTYRGYWKNDGEKLEERAATGFSGRETLTRLLLRSNRYRAFAMFRNSDMDRRKVAKKM